MALMDDPFVQLVAQIAHRREPDFLKSVLREERSECTNGEDNQQDDEDLAPLLARLRVPPGVEALRDAVVAVDEPSALSFRPIALHHDVEDPLLRAAGLTGDFRGRPRQDLVEQRLAERDHHGLRDREDEHRPEGDDCPSFVSREIAVQPPQRAHVLTVLIIASAALLLAPGPPNFSFTAASSVRKRDEFSMSERTSRAMRSPLTSSCRSSGTTFLPAMMLTRLKCGSLTRRCASQCVGDESRYMTTTGVPAIAHSSVAVPEDDNATSAFASVSPRSCGTIRTNSPWPCITFSSSADEIVGA